MSTGFDARALDFRYAFLDDCPEALFQQVATLTVGTLKERVAGVLCWRCALLEGRVPSPDPWPGRAIGGPVVRSIQELGLARFCKGEEELVDAVLGDMLDGVRDQTREFRQEVLDELRRLEALERQRREDEHASRKRKGPVPDLDDVQLERLRDRAREIVDGGDRGSDEALREQWEERVRAWATIADVFGDLGNMLGRGWDLAQGVLRHIGWRDLLALRRLVEQLPQVRGIVQSLGRLQVSDADEIVAAQILEPVRRLEEELREVRTPLVPAETRGVERSGKIERMLPAEAVNLGHPQLRLLWHARRAENALLTYRVEGVEFERVEIETERMEERDQEAPRPERGPIIAVVDTSGSMQGIPERVAKALVLEVLRVAHHEQRACYLFAYSGPGQVVETELDLGPDGIGALLRFLSLSFGGGTDVEVIAQVVGILQTERWKKADVVIASDGEWRAGRHIIEGVEAAREQGTRFHGVQIGNRGVSGLHQVCDPVHVFRDWAALGGDGRR